jgi:hypothetical protein
VVGRSGSSGSSGSSGTSGSSGSSPVEEKYTVIVVFDRLLTV